MISKKELAEYRELQIEAYGFFEGLINYYNDAVDMDDEVCQAFLEQMIDLAMDYLIY